MRFHHIVLCAAPALVAIPATAGPLSVVTVNSPAINCVYETDCTITVTDSVGTIPVPNLTAGVARLQTRSFAGQSGAPAAGKTGYEYRVDLTSAVTNAEFSCVTDLTVDFGAITKLQYNNAGPADEVYVITHGGLGKIGLLFAEQNGSSITFTFSQPVCAGHTPNSGDTTFFFGLTSAFAPRAITANVGVPGLLPVDVKARGPNHPRVVPPIALDRPAVTPTASSFSPQPAADEKHPAADDGRSASAGDARYTPADDKPGASSEQKGPASADDKRPGSPDDK